MFILYSNNNQIIIKEDNDIVYLVNSFDASLGMINNEPIISDNYNKPNAKGTVRFYFGSISNIMSDTSTLFSNFEELQTYFNSIV